LGMRVACVEKDPALGGTCLNIGCIPSKALLDSSELFAQARRGLAVHGVKTNGVERVKGTGRLAAGPRVVVGDRTLEATRVLIATGSEPAPLPGLPFDGERIVSSTEALALGRVPERLLVIGAGALGLELGSVWSRLGARVTVVEIMDGVVPGMDRGMATQLRRSLEK